MNNHDRLDYLIGQVATLKAFCIALAITHREPAVLQRIFTRVAEITTAKTLPTEASEAMLGGMENMANDLLQVLQGESTRRPAGAP